MSDFKRVERLMLFVELAQHLNFTRAAEVLGVSKGHLSDQTKKLELELQCPLLVRTTRSVRLTQEGERAYQQGLRIRSQVLELERNVSSEHDSISGTLRITAPKMFAEIYLFDICAKFRDLHPDIKFEINSSYTNFNLNQDDIDLAFRATMNPPENMVASLLIPYQHYLVASPSYIEANGTPENLGDLSQHQCLTTLHQSVWPMKSQDVAVDGWIATNENHLLKQQALLGHGIVRIASYYVDQEIQSGRLVKVLEHEYLKGQNSIYLFYPQVIYPSQKLKAFVKFVQAYFD